MDYLKGIFDNVYMNDVIERNKIKSKDEINILVDILASAIGAFTNPTKISNIFVTERHSNYTHKTISSHIDFLEEAYLISKANVTIFRSHMIFPQKKNRIRNIIHLETFPILSKKS